MAREQIARRIADVLGERLADDVAVALADPGRPGRAGWRVTVHFRRPPDRSALRALIAEAAGPQTARALAFGKVAAKDWVGASLAGLTPVAAGRFVVHGAHHRTRIAANRLGIEIEAALAFGTGHHGTTRACLLALDRLCKSVSKVCRHPEVAAKRPSKGDGPGRHPSRRAHSASKTRVNAPVGAHLRMTGTKLLDLGTGSGVLAIAAARAWRRRVLASDIDVAAVRVARANAKRNRVGSLVEVVRADGVVAPAIRAQAPFDLVFANILLEPLQRLAAPLTRLLAPGGRVVLSGLLAGQANAALFAYRPLALERRIDLDGWPTLVLRRGRRRA